MMNLLVESVFVLFAVSTSCQEVMSSGDVPSPVGKKGKRGDEAQGDGASGLDPIPDGSLQVGDWPGTGGKNLEGRSGSYILSNVLEEGCPDKCLCNNLTTVSCVGANLNRIPDDLLLSTISLDMSDNFLRVLTSRTFDKRFSNLIEIKLKKNNIEEIIVDGDRISLTSGDEGDDDDERHVFTNVPSLQSLDLGDNKLIALVRGSFWGTDNLLHLDLSGNKLTDVWGAFDRLPHLFRLDLRRNRLTSLGSSVLEGLSNLRYLRLDDNRITRIDPHAFTALKNLMYLALTTNPLGDQLSRLHFSSSVLSYVDMSECKLVKVPRGLPSGVRYLQLRRNNITHIGRQSLTEMNDSLSILVLDENIISGIEDGTFERMTRLQQVWLNGNHLTSVPRPLPPNLQRLFIDSNRLMSISGADFHSYSSQRMTELPPYSSPMGAKLLSPSSHGGVELSPYSSQLNSISMMGNAIIEISNDAFHRLPQLKSLDLSANLLRRLPGGLFRANSKLETLQLSKNPLETLERGSLLGLTSLQALSMSYIPAARIQFEGEDELRDLVNLVKLDMDSSPGLISAIFKSAAPSKMSFTKILELSMLNCDLQSLPLSFTLLFPSLSHLSLSSSSWHCNSSILPLRDLLLSPSLHSSLPTLRALNRCLTPPNLYDRLVTSLIDADFRFTPLFGVTSATNMTSMTSVLRLNISESAETRNTVFTESVRFPAYITNNYNNFGSNQPVSRLNLHEQEQKNDQEQQQPQQQVKKPEQEQEGDQSDWHGTSTPYKYAGTGNNEGSFQSKSRVTSMQESQPRVYQPQPSGVFLEHPELGEIDGETGPETRLGFSKEQDPDSNRHRHRHHLHRQLDYQHHLRTRLQNEINEPGNNGRHLGSSKYNYPSLYSSDENNHHPVDVNQQNSQRPVYINQSENNLTNHLVYTTQEELIGGGDGVPHPLPSLKPLSQASDRRLVVFLASSLILTSALAVVVIATLIARICLRQSHEHDDVIKSSIRSCGGGSGTATSSSSTTSSSCDSRGESCKTRAPGALSTDGKDIKSSSVGQQQNSTGSSEKTILSVTSTKYTNERAALVSNHSRSPPRFSQDIAQNLRNGLPRDDADKLANPLSLEDAGNPSNGLPRHDSGVLREYFVAPPSTQVSPRHRLASRDRVTCQTSCDVKHTSRDDVTGREEGSVIRGMGVKPPCIAASGAAAPGGVVCMTLVSGRDINHDGPLRVYKWEDF